MINPGTAEPKAESVDIKEYISILLKRKWLILVCFLVSMAGTTAFLFTRQPIYRANSKLLVTISGSGVQTAEVKQEDARTFYGTQVDIMRSQTMLKRVQQRLKKTPDEIAELLNGLTVAPVRGSDIIAISVDSTSKDFAKDFGNALADEYLRHRDELRAAGAEAALLTMTREINRLSQELKSSQERMLAFAKERNITNIDTQQSVFRWQFWRVMQEMGDAASSLANAHALKQQIESRPSIPKLVSLLTAEASQPTAAQTPASEAGTASFPATAPAFGMELDPGLQPQNFFGGAANTNSTAMNAPGSQGPFTQLPDAAQKEGESSRRPNIFALSESRARKLLDLERERHFQQSKLDEMKKVYRDKHPAIAQNERLVADVTAQINIEVEFVRESAEADIQFAQRRYDQLKEAFDQMSQKVLSESASYLEMRTMADDTERIKTLHNALLSQLMKIDVSQGFNSRAISVLEPAILEPEPIYPKKSKGMMVAAGFGLGLGLALAFFIEYIDDSIKLAEDVERELQLPFLGMIPAAQWDPEDLSAHRLDKLKQQGGVSEAYRVVRSAILFSTPREKLRSILITSAVPREGKTTTGVNVAIGFSQVEDRVLLVDADLRRGEVNKYFGYERARGLADVLLGEATPEEVVRHTEVPKLDVITTGSYPSNPAELLLGWRLKEFLDWAHKNYNRVVFDGPPVMGIADSSILGSAVDGVMLVIWAGRTSRRYVRVAKMTAAGRGAKIIGFILNNLEPSRVGYYHYYPYYYSYYTRGYYYAPKEDEKDKGKGGDIKGIEVPSANQAKKDIDDVY